MPKAITQFDEIYAVGDSLSDSGGIYKLSSRALSLIARWHRHRRTTAHPDQPALCDEVLQRTGAARNHRGTARRDAASIFHLAVPKPLARIRFAISFHPTLLTAINALPDRAGTGRSGTQSWHRPYRDNSTDLTAALSVNPPSEDSALVSLIGLNDFLSLLGSVDPNDPTSIAARGRAGQAPIPQIIAANHHAAADRLQTSGSTRSSTRPCLRPASSRRSLRPSPGDGRCGHRCRQSRPGG